MNGFSDMFKGEAPRENNYVKAIKSYGYESGRTFPMNEVIVASNDINPQAQNTEELGGLNVADHRSVLRWLIRGDTLCDVVIPEEGKIYEVVNGATNGGTYRASKIILSNPRPIDDNLAMEMYKTSDLPWESYIQILAYLSSMNFKGVSDLIINDKINKDNAAQALEIFDTYLERRSNPMPDTYTYVLNKIKELM